MASDLSEGDIYKLISKASPGVIKDLAISYLNIKSSDIAHLRASCREDTKEIAFKTVLMWRDRTIGTKKQLFDKCEEARINEDVEMSFIAYSFLCPGAVPRTIPDAEEVPQLTNEGQSSQYPSLEGHQLGTLAGQFPKKDMITLARTYFKISEVQLEESLDSYQRDTEGFKLNILQMWSKNNNGDRKKLAQIIHASKKMKEDDIIKYLEVKREDFTG